MRNLALVFFICALLGAAIVACDGSNATEVRSDLIDSPSLTNSGVSSAGLSMSSGSVLENSSETVYASSSSVVALVSSSSQCEGAQCGAGVSSSSIDSVASSSSRCEGEQCALASSSSEVVVSSSSEEEDGDDGKCTACDSYTAADPELTENGGKGSVTTYGSVTAKETSLGGACNYGQTNIQYYAAIHVNVSPGDNKGPWQGGAACGGCVRVKAKTPDGWKKVTVRITDRCPDADCGVDLGGAPASDIMGINVGRYYGEWEFVSCEGVEGVWGDSTSLWVKEGASEFWSIVQVRNPKDMVKAIKIYGVDSRDYYELEMVVGTENFWTVPVEVLKTDNRYRVVVSYRTGTDDEWKIKGSELAEPEANLYLWEHRE